MKQTLKIINELKSKKVIRDYAIGGGIAALFYIEPFLTYDLDVFIIPKQQTSSQGLILLAEVFAYLKLKGYIWKGEHIFIEGVPVQFIPTDALEQEAVESAQEIEYEGVKSKVISPEYLIVILLRAGRNKDIEKIKRLIEQAKLNRTKLDLLLKKYKLQDKFESISA